MAFLSKIPPPSLEAARPILEGLAALLPDPACELNYRNPFELLIATQLSAQSTDVMVNKVTPELFKRFPDVHALAAADLAEVERIIRSTGFFRNKAKHAVETARLLIENFQGEVPKRMADLITLPGVARKTAAVVLGTAFGIAEGITVDTHAFRVSLRWGWHAEHDPQKVEQILMQFLPRDTWIATGHRLVLFGRHHCTARAPACGSCTLKNLCPVGLGGDDPHEARKAG